VAVALVWACGGSQHDDSLSYGDNAREAYAAAMDDFRDEDCLEAEPAFRRVRREYPFSRYAPLAELRVADCLFIQQKLPEAIAAYRRFVRNRPSHPEVPYARFKIAESYFEQIPDDWLLAPPAHERDQGPTREALRQLRRFILDFPEDERVQHANELARQALALLARHELYAAEFYLNRDHPQAAIGRLRTLLTAYEGSGVEPEAMLLLGRVFLEMRDRAEARRTFQQLIERYPSSGYAEQARAYLSELGG
jgi:outer membrane protein assembly factor BamD